MRAPHRAPVALVGAALQLVVRVGPDSDLPRVNGLVDALADGYTDRVRGVWDNRDERVIRPAPDAPGRDPFRQVRAALAHACGAERDPAAAAWATTTHYDTADRTVLPAFALGCALGRRLQPTGELGVALSLVLFGAEPWAEVHGRARTLADGWPGLWRWLTVGYLFVPLPYNGLDVAHSNIRRVAPRMPAVDVGDTLGLHTSRWTAGLRSVGWASFLAPDLTAQCGSLLHEGAPGLDVAALRDGGASVRVPGDPDPGSTPRYAPPGLARADALLRPARATDGVVFLPPWDEDSTREWLERWQTLAPNDA